MKNDRVSHILCYFEIHNFAQLWKVWAMWSTYIVSSSYWWSLHFCFYRMKNYWVVLILCYFKIHEIGFRSILGPILKIWSLGPNPCGPLTLFPLPIDVPNILPFTKWKNIELFSFYLVQYIWFLYVGTLFLWIEEPGSAFYAHFFLSSPYYNKHFAFYRMKKYWL